MILSLLGGILLVAGSLRGSFARMNFETIQENYTEDATVTVSGLLYKKTEKNGKFQYFIRDTSLNELEILCYLEEDELPLGSSITLSGRVYPFSEARNYGNFDSKSYYRSLGIPFALTDVSVSSCLLPQIPIAQGLYDLKCRIREVYREILNEEDAGVISAVVLGEKADLSDTVKESYQKAGISHILAVSGLHVSLIGMGLYRLLRKRRIPVWLAALLSGSFMCLYLNLSGYAISATRAVLMFLLLLLAKCMWRSYDLLSALGLSGIVILWSDPLAVTNTGFAFSFLAILGVGAIADQLGYYLKGEEERKPHGLVRVFVYRLKNTFCDSLLVSIGISLTTLPLVCLSYFETPTLSVFLNLIVIPLMSPMLFAAIAGGISGLVLGTGLFTRILFLPVYLILRLFDLLCEYSSRLPFSTLLAGKPSGLQLGFYYSALTGFFYALCFLTWRKQVMLAKGKHPPRASEDQAKQRKWRVGAGRAALLFFMAGGLILILLFPKKNTNSITVLDVGQGDGTCISLKNGFRLFIDGGSTDVDQVGKYRIQPYLKASRIGSIDYWFLSHADQDHYSGLLELIEAGYPIGHLVISPVTLEDEGAEELLAAYQSYEPEGEILLMTRGDTMDFKEAYITCLWPLAGASFSDRNEGSLGFTLEFTGFTGLFLGDLPSTQEGNLTGLGPVTYYKCSHHGSKYSTGQEFLDQICPEMTTISCGIDNSYGHPAAETVKRLENSGTSLYDTRVCGQIEIQIEGEAYRVVKFLSDE